MECFHVIKIINNPEYSVRKHIAEFGSEETAIAFSKEELARDKKNGDNNTHLQIVKSTCTSEVD